MRKLGIFLLIIVLGVSCVQNNVDAQSSNDAQRIVGTWRGLGQHPNSNSSWARITITIVFNANGTFNINSVVDDRDMSQYDITVN